MGARDAGGIDSQHHAEAPAPRDGLVGAFGAFAQDDLGDNAVAEEDEDEDAEEFRKGLPQCAADAAPQEVRFRLHGFFLGYLVVDKWSMFCVGELPVDRSPPSLCRSRSCLVRDSQMFLVVSHGGRFVQRR